MNDVTAHATTSWAAYGEVAPVHWVVHPWTKVMRLQSLMNFALRCVPSSPGVNSRAELVTLAPGLRPEQRFAPLARGS